MEISIKQNDSYRELSKIVSISENKLSEYIINKLEKEEIIGDYQYELSFTIKEVMENYGDYNTSELAYLLFPDFAKNNEVVHFLENLVFWGVALDNPCQQCGCQMEKADIDQWHELECSNSECSYILGEKK